MIVEHLERKNSHVVCPSYLDVVWGCATAEEVDGIVIMWCVHFVGHHLLTVNFWNENARIEFVAIMGMGCFKAAYKHCTSIWNPNQVYSFIVFLSDQSR